MRPILLLVLLAFPSAAQTLPGFSIDNLDKTADPCVDFYQYACGTWMAKHPMPPDQTRWGVLALINDRNRGVLQNILEQAAVSDPKRAPDDQKIGDYYASCMDEPAIEKLGIKPLQPELDRINALAAKPALAAELARLHLVNVAALFRFSAGPDYKDSNVNIADVDQGGLGLADRDYYLKDDARSTEVRAHYVAHVQKMLELLGEHPDTAHADAQAILDFETQLAKASLDRVSRREPSRIYHKLSVQQLQALTPGFSWQTYWKGLGTPAFAELNVAVPDYFKALDSILAGTDLAVIKTYLRWHLVHAEAPVLPKAFVEEDFSFYRHFMSGATEQQPRWKRCVAAVDADLGFALGRKFVDATFGAEGKARTLKMVQQIEAALNSDIRSLSWMTPATRQQALAKLQAVANKIGYPDKWRDYSALRIVRGDAVGNDQRASEFAQRRRLDQIGKPVDRSEWRMTPPTVNAGYSPLENSINFPAGILQPPLYDNRMDAAVNFGAGGSAIGHELTHGFDDQGRKFDAQGNLADWWTPEDAQEFEKRVDCFVQEYSSFTPVDNVHLNGKLTLGENTADNGGLRLAFMALMQSFEGHAQPKIDGFTAEQRFFLAYGQTWCENMRPEEARLRAQTDPHSPGRFRVNGVLHNMPEFQQAFSCQVGQPMVRIPPCRVW